LAAYPVAATLCRACAMPLRQPQRTAPATTTRWINTFFDAHSRLGKEMVNKDTSLSAVARCAQEK
jgi:hypothetical protein